MQCIMVKVKTDDFALALPQRAHFFFSQNRFSLIHKYLYGTLHDLRQIY